VGDRRERVTELWRTNGTPGNAALVLDINAGSANSSPAFGAVAGGYLYFAATDVTNGRELWRTDGFGTGLAANLRSGSGSSSPHSFTGIGNTLYFGATDDTGKSHLWKTVGITTTRLTSAADTIASDTIDFNGTLYFINYDSTFGRELWTSDGSPVGTVRVTDTPMTSSPYDMLVAQNQLYIAGFNGLWKSDGTAAGTVQVVSGDCFDLVNVGGTVFFTHDPVVDYEIWKVTGDSAEMVFDHTDAPSGAALGSVLIFEGQAKNHGFEPWRSDGTPAGTYQITELNAGFYNGQPKPFYAGEQGFFVPNDGELWVNNGVSPAAYRVKDINPTDVSNPSGFVNANGILLFFADDGVHGRELWRSDGTDVGTYMYDELTPGSGGFSPTSYMADFNGVGIFTLGGDIWRTDGTPAGTYSLASGTASNSPDAYCVIGSILYFAETDGLIRTDGTPAGTYSISPPELTSARHLINCNGTLYFAGQDAAHGTELWKSDGTLAGTGLVKEINPLSSTTFMQHPVAVGGVLFFDARVSGDTGIWRSDGTDPGTYRLKDTYVGGDDIARPMGGVNGKFLFQAYEPTHGLEIWVSDGTEGGTTLLRDINPGGNGSYPSGPGIECATVGQTAYFNANDGVHGTELWSTDGTPAGTNMVIDLNPLGDSVIQKFQVANGTLRFEAKDGFRDMEYWKLGPVSINADADDVVTVGMDPTGFYRQVSINGSPAALINNATFDELTVNAPTPGHAVVIADSNLLPDTRTDLTGADLIVLNGQTGTWNGSAYTGITGLVASGRNGGTWDGNGITTSAASGSLTGLGVASAADALHLSGNQTGVFDGQTVHATDTLVMYTYIGDANLDGKLNVDDYGRIDTNIGLGAAGWFNGDFNYDGKRRRRWSARRRSA
jgi:ELWxxDGT repeat protein